MRKAMVIFVLTAMCLAVAAVSSAEEADEAKGSKMKDASKWCKMSHKNMMKSAEMVATDDDGVIILKGKSLMKYDKDLNLVKAVKLEMKKKESGSQAKGSATE